MWRTKEKDTLTLASGSPPLALTFI
jgi:hypothetical protein